MKHFHHNYKYQGIKQCIHMHYYSDYQMYSKACQTFYIASRHTDQLWVKML